MSNPVVNYEYAQIRAREIFTDRVYQRPTNRSAIMNNIRKYNSHLVNPVKVVERGSGYYAVDGQHTVLTLVAKYGEDVLVPCLILHDVKNWREEAELFELANIKGARRNARAGDIWRSRIAREEPNTMAIKEIVTATGHSLNLTGTGGDKGIKALSTLEQIYLKRGGALLTEVLDIIYRAWGKDNTAVSSAMLNGMSEFVSAYHGIYDKTVLVNKMKRTAPELIIRAGKASSAPGSTKYAREILAIYNKGRSSTALPDKL